MQRSKLPFIFVSIFQICLNTCYVESSWCLSFLIIFPHFCNFPWVFCCCCCFCCVCPYSMLIWCWGLRSFSHIFMRFFWKRGFIIAFTGTVHRFYSSGASRKEVRVTGDGSARVLWVCQVNPDLTRTLPLFCQHTSHTIQYQFGYCGSWIFMCWEFQQAQVALLKWPTGESVYMSMTTRKVMPPRAWYQECLDLFNVNVKYCLGSNFYKAFIVRL